MTDVEHLAAQLAEHEVKMNAHHDERQKLEDNARSLAEKVRDRGPGVLGKDERRLRALVTQIEAASVRGRALQAEHTRLAQRLGDARRMVALSRHLNLVG